MDPASVADEVRAVADESGFAGLVRVDRCDAVVVDAAFGLADRRHAVRNTTSTRFGLASGTKGITAVTVLSLVADGTLQLDTTARSILRDDLPLIDERVTIEHLLSHRSGIGDYLDEGSGGTISDYVMPVPVHLLASSEDYLTVLDGHPQVFAPGSRFAYNNSGFVVLAVIAERVTGIAFHELAERRVLAPAGMTASGFLRSDELPGDAATGYLDAAGLRTNVLHLPVRGSGDGGMYATAADVRRFWRALFDGALLPRDLVDEMTAVRSVDGSDAYGLGCWLDPGGRWVALEGYDAGASFRSVHDSSRDLTMTVLSNTTSGAWRLAARCAELLDLVPTRT